MDAAAQRACMCAARAPLEFSCDRSVQHNASKNVEPAGVEQRASHAKPEKDRQVLDNTKGQNDQERADQRKSRHVPNVLATDSSQAMKRISPNAEVEVEERDKATEREQRVGNIRHDRQLPAAHNGYNLGRRTLPT